MITPAAYENLVAAHFQAHGYRTTITTYSGDYGLDVLAENAVERVAIQAKLYGHTSRHVNRQMVMELHGVKDYFDCTRAVIATDGVVRDDAREVAAKLGIDILYLGADRTANADVEHPESSPTSQRPASASLRLNLTFDQIWIDHVMPLAGRTLQGRGSRTNKIVNVDWAGVERISSGGNRGRIDVEIFRLTVNHLLAHGTITRDEINQNYSKRASSGVMLLLSQVPLFRVESHPTMRLVIDIDR